MSLSLESVHTGTDNSELASKTTQGIGYPINLFDRGGKVPPVDDSLSSYTYYSQRLKYLVVDSDDNTSHTEADAAPTREQMHIMHAQFTSIKYKLKLYIKSACMTEYTDFARSHELKRPDGILVRSGRDLRKYLKTLSLTAENASLVYALLYIDSSSNRDSIKVMIDTFMKEYGYYFVEGTAPRREIRKAPPGYYYAWHQIACEGRSAAREAIQRTMYTGTGWKVLHSQPRVVKASETASRMTLYVDEKKYDYYVVKSLQLEQQQQVSGICLLYQRFHTVSLILPLFSHVQGERQQQLLLLPLLSLVEHQKSMSNSWRSYLELQVHR